MNKTTSILVTRSEKTTRGQEFDHRFSIDSLLSECSNEREIEVMNRISALNIESPSGIPYSIFWHRFAWPKKNNIIHCIMLHDRLISEFEEMDVEIEELICDSTVNEPFSLVLEDVARELSVSFRQIDANKSTSVSRIVGGILLFMKVVALLFDELVSMVAGLANSDSDPETVFFPAINRMKSSLSVLESFEEKPKVITLEPTIYQFISDSNDQISNYDLESIHRYLTPRHFAGHLRDLGRLARELFGTNQLKTALVAEVEREFDTYLPSTIDYLVSDVLGNFRFIRALLLRRTVRSLNTRLDHRKAVVGTLDPVGRAIIHESLEYDKRVFHIPHSIATRYPPNPPQKTVQFVSGKFDTNYYEGHVPDKLAWDWVPLGRPYLSDLYHTHQQSPKNDLDIDQLDVLVATQPLNMEIRREFVSTVVESLKSSPHQFSVTVKTHPDEEAKVYQQFESERVSVETRELFEHIKSADLVLTINSNVGLESIVLGTPCVCFNQWRPFVLDQTFALHDDVPVFRSRKELSDFFYDLDLASLESLRTNQECFLNRNYRLSPTVAQDIAAYIEDA